MFKISRMTDYGVVVMAQLAQATDAVVTAPDLASGAGLPAPTVAKILKRMSRGGLVTSHRGMNGGYALSRPAAEISVADIIGALEGPVAVTACVDGASGDACSVESLCPIRGCWDRVNAAVTRTLQSMSLAEIATPPNFIDLPAARESAPADS
ncbi:MAG: SUF system Fe-S cluster assembly regulator [Alphaproteobacteria bacterium]|nr:SUF system Fe-S cluster assembly regulator [Alphaproteobacteria bacterium]